MDSEVVDSEGVEFEGVDSEGVDSEVVEFAGAEFEGVVVLSMRTKTFWAMTPETVGCQLPIQDGFMAPFKHGTTALDTLLPLSAKSEVSKQYSELPVFKYSLALSADGILRQLIQQ